MQSPTLPTATQNAFPQTAVLLVGLHFIVDVLQYYILGCHEFCKLYVAYVSRRTINHCHIALVLLTCAPFIYVQTNKLSLKSFISKDLLRGKLHMNNQARHELHFITHKR